MRHRVLVVDDDPSTADLLRELLAPWHVELVVANEVHEAVDLLVGGSFAAVVLNLMPVESNGFDILDAMRHANVGTRAIVISTRFPEYASYLLNPVQVLTIMRKPFDTEVMVAAILGLCGAAGNDATRSENGSANTTESQTDL
jgi:DNA-binding response OmpR family regulator